jgi:hypothetical protein
MMIITILQRLWAVLATRPAPSPYDAPAFREWLAAQRGPFALSDAAQAAGFIGPDLTRDNCVRTGVALRRLGFRRIERRDSGTRYWYIAQPGLVPDMPSRQAGYYNLDFTGFFIALFVVGALVGAAAVYGVPWVWGLIKPLLHEVTR